MKPSVALSCAVLLTALCCLQRATANPQPQVANGPDGCTFKSEEVRLEIGSTALLVDAEYLFQQRGDGQLVVITFPFISDSTMGTPDQVECTATYDSEPARPLRYSRNRAGLMWTLDFRFAKSCRVHVKYSQRLSRHRAGYVLTSMQNWRVPLDRARVTVRFLFPVSQPRFSLPLVRVATVGPGSEYQGSFENWMPDSDLVVTW